MEKKQEIIQISVTKEGPVKSPIIKDDNIWRERAAAMAAMLALLGISTKEILEGDTNVAKAHYLRALVSCEFDFDLEDKIELLQTPINGG